MIRVGIDLKLFDILEARRAPLSLDEIVKTTGGDSQLIGQSKSTSGLSILLTQS